MSEAFRQLCRAFVEALHEASLIQGYTYRPESKPLVASLVRTACQLAGWAAWPARQEEVVMMAAEIAKQQEEKHESTDLWRWQSLKSRGMPMSFALGLEQMGMPELPHTPVGEAVRATAAMERESLDWPDEEYDALVEAVMLLYRTPGLRAEALAQLLAALRPAVSRAIVCGRISADANLRHTPLRGSKEPHLARYCQWCHATEDVKPCASCSVAHYCTSGPCCARDAARHEIWCFDLLTSRLLYCALPGDALEFDRLARRSPLTQYVLPLPMDRSEEALPGDWKSYFAARWPGITEFEKLVLTESISSPLTLLRVLDGLNLRGSKTQSAQLRVLVAGAACEVDQPWGELLPFCSWKRIELVLVGPGMTGECSREIKLPPLNRQIVLVTNPALIQDVNELGAFDLVVAFNSGMIHYPSWPAALLRIRSLACPLVVTAWVLHEVAGVHQLLRDAGFLAPTVSPNPFPSHVPQRVAFCQGTACFCNRFSITTAPAGVSEWEPFLRPATGAPSVEDLQDALRLLQGRAEVILGVHAALDGILDDPDGFNALMQEALAARGESNIPDEIRADMAEAWRLLNAAGGSG